ncbi:MAG: hypothetical protein KAR11_08300 [Phycisphaerae bacterium]|nr:hypothetical protein [Phycisphaerae bacterium]
MIKRTNLLVIAILCLAATGCEQPPPPAAMINNLTDLPENVDELCYFFGYDVLTRPGEKIPLLVHLKSIRLDRTVAGITVEFRLDGKPIDAAVSNCDGDVQLHWTPPGAGIYKVTGHVISVATKFQSGLVNLPPARLLIAVLPKTTRITVVDLDSSLIADSMVRARIGRAKPTPDSAKVLREIAKESAIVYRTAWPAEMTSNTKDWLVATKYPDGPLLLSSLTPRRYDSKLYAPTSLQQLRLRFPHMTAGIAGCFEEIEEFRSCGMKGYWLLRRCRDKAALVQQNNQLRTLDDDQICPVNNWLQLGEILLESAP